MIGSVSHIGRMSLAAMILTCGCFSTIGMGSDPDRDKSAARIGLAQDIPFSTDVFEYLNIDDKSGEIADLEKGAHPLLPILQYAYTRHQAFDTEVDDYQCKFAKRVRMNGNLLPQEIMALKLRHERLVDEQLATPFSVYMKFMAPLRVSGREVIYVEGQHNNMLMATKGGPGALKNITTRMDPEDPRAMRGDEFPITRVGILNLTQLIIEEGVKCVKADTSSDCVIRDQPGAKINGRPCRFIEVRFPNKREGLKFHIAQILVDEAIEMPVRFSAHYWPRESDEAPPLLLEYTYYDLEPNKGLSDQDFEESNPEYDFYQRDKTRSE